MVDLISTRTIDITKLAMDGLMTRQKAIMANTANVMTPDYTRKEVNFESQLREMVANDNLKQLVKEQNSVQYNPSSIETALGYSDKHQLTNQEAKFLQSNVYQGFEPQIVDDTVSGAFDGGNNVDLEQEVMDMAKVGTKYAILSTLEGKQLKNVSSAIRGDGS